MKLFRIGIQNFPVFSSFGATQKGGRWNSAGMPVIYAATSLAGAKLELFARIGFEATPAGYLFVQIDVSDATKFSKYDLSVVPTLAESKAWGDGWLVANETVMALVPSRASPGDWNALLNPRHPDFGSLDVSKEKPVRWDTRHFRKPKTLK